MTDDELLEAARIGYRLTALKAGEPISLRRPPSKAYNDLIQTLYVATTASPKGQDELTVALGCLIEVLRFLDSDIDVRAMGATRPLGMLATAIRDTLRGAKPALLFQRSKKGPGRPTETSFEAARGAIAAAVASLIEGGESRNEAGRFVANVLGNEQFKLPNGKAISANQVLRWRDEMGASASKLAESNFRDVLGKYRDTPSELVRTKQARRNVVLGALRGLRAEGF